MTTRGAGGSAPRLSLERAPSYRRWQANVSLRTLCHPARKRALISPISRRRPRTESGSFCRSCRSTNHSRHAASFGGTPRWRRKATCSRGRSRAPHAWAIVFALTHYSPRARQIPRCLATTCGGRSSSGRLSSRSRLPTRGEGVAARVRRSFARAARAVARCGPRRRAGCAFRAVAIAVPARRPERGFEPSPTSSTHVAGTPTG